LCVGNYVSFAQIWFRKAIKKIEYRLSTEKTSFLRRTGRFSIATIISRITGLLRETTLAALFGAGSGMDAFVAAFRIPNLLRDLFAEGALSAAYVPTFTEKLKKEGKESAFEVTSAIFSILLVVLGIIVILGIILAPYYVKYYVSGFADDPAKMRLTVIMTQIMFPFLLLVAVAAAAMGTLNSLGRFGVPAVAPAAFNIITIIMALFFSRYFDPPILVLGVGVVVGGIGQFGIQIPQLVRAGYRFRFRLAFRDEAVRRILKLLLPAALGVAAWQVNVVVGTIIASYLEPGSIASLYYALRLMHFPLGVFGVALAAVSLPHLSSLVSGGDLKGASEAQRYSSRMVIFLLLPSAAYLIGAAEAIVALAYQRGQFAWADTLGVALALRAYAVGLVFFGLVRVTAQVFYAFKDTATPVKISLAAVATNIALSLLLMGPLSIAGLALATSAAAIVNFSLLNYYSRKKAPAPDRHGLSSYSIKIALAASLAGFGAYGVMRIFLGPGGFGGFSGSLAAVMVSFVVSALIYFIVCRIWGIDELRQVLGLFSRSSKSVSDETVDKAIEP
jgi:putative peptidoglycan lipid II flippase